MKLIAFSDLHGENLDFVKPVGYDVCVIAGDIAPLEGFGRWQLEKQGKWMQFVFGEWVSRYPETEFVFVAGNHDFWGTRIMPQDSRWPINAHYLCNSGCEVCGRKFWGSPNVTIINYRWAFESTDIQLRDSFGIIAEDTDILITHMPPRVEGSDIDVSLGDADYRREHFGSVALAEAIETVQPEFAFCGHIHTGDHGCTEIGATKCFNVSLLDEDYLVRYMPFETEI